MSSYVLEVRQRDGEPKLVPVRHIPFWIGRDSKNDLALPDPFVSRRHAFIDATGQQVTIVDNHSRNGVFVNHRPVTDRCELRSGDVISVGPFELRFSLAARPTSSPAHDGTEAVEYFSRGPNWDPIRTLTSGLTRDSRVPTDRTVPWDKLLRLLVGGSPDHLYQLILDAVEQLVALDRCFIILIKNGDLETLQIVAARFGKYSVTRNATDVYVSRDVLRRVVERGEAVVVNADESTFKPSDSFRRSGARSLLCIPLMTRGQVFGALYLDRFTEERGFSEQTVSQLAPLTGLVSLKVENLRLLEEQVEIRINRRELETAKAIQERYLPTSNIRLPGYAFHTFSQPCRQVGGDCIDFVDGTGEKLTFAIGDVAGKGLPAALYMIGVMSTLRAHLADGFGARDVMVKLEQYVRRRFRPDHFLTLFLGELDRATGTLSYCNAGHMLPMVFSRGGPMVELEPRDPALNIMPWDDFTLSTYPLKPGDLLLVYTDGLTDQMNAEGERFGRDRLISGVQARIEDDLKTIRRGLLTDLDLFGATRSHLDDVAMILLRRADDNTRR